MSDDELIPALLLLETIIFCLIYTVPSIVAFRRVHPNRWIILVVNFAFGGAVIGWGIALAWALRAVHRPGAAPDGGESGLNIFVNDMKKVQIVRTTATTKPFGDELERLNGLLARGAISQGEFDVLKAKLMAGAS